MTARPDMLGLSRNAPDRVLPLLLAATVFLATLAGAAGLAVSRAATQWRQGAEPAITVEVPEPDAPAAAAILGSQAHRLTTGEMATLLRPWLSDQAAKSIDMPATFILPGDLTKDEETRLQQAAPGALVTRNTAWQSRLAGIAASLRRCSQLALALAAFIAIGIVGVTAHAGLAARRDTIEIVHGLGGTDRQIAGRFARHLATLAGAGGLLGVALCIPVLLGLAHLAAPLGPAGAASHASFVSVLPATIWTMFAALPVCTAVIGWLAAQLTVRAWLACLP